MNLLRFNAVVLCCMNKFMLFVLLLCNQTSMHAMEKSKNSSSLAKKPSLFDGPSLLTGSSSLLTDGSSLLTDGSSLLTDGSSLLTDGSSLIVCKDDKKEQEEMQKLFDEDEKKNEILYEKTMQRIKDSKERNSRYMKKKTRMLQEGKPTDSSKIIEQVVLEHRNVDKAIEDYYAQRSKENAAFLVVMKEQIKQLEE